MIKQPGHVRPRIVIEIDRMLACCHSFISFLPETETDVLLALQSPMREEMAKDIVLLMLGCFGHEEQSDSRFSQTNRALAKKPKGLRGANTFDNGQDRKKAQETV